MEISNDLLTVIQSGGVPALIMYLIFTYRVLTRIEKMMDIFVKQFIKDNPQ